MNIKKIGIIGSGTMGCQLTELFLKYGFNVTLFSRSSDGIERSLNKFRGSALAKKLQTTTNIKDLKTNDLLIECVKEDLKIKQRVLKKLDGIVKENAIIGSNTSSIPLKFIVRDCKNKSNMLGIHFSNPAMHMKLVEIVKHDFVSEETIDHIIKLLKKIDKEPIIVKDTPGFLLNRMLFPMLNEAANMLHKGIATRNEIDKIMVLGANHPVGPLRIIDLVGIDVTVAILKNLQKELKDNKFNPSPILLKKLKQKRLGVKTKKGFYEY